MTSVKAHRALVRFRAGPTWTGGSILDQPGWDEHAAFIDDLIERGVMVMGGPFADSSGSVSVFENVDEHLPAASPQCIYPTLPLARHARSRCAGAVTEWLTGL